MKKIAFASVCLTALLLTGCAGNTVKSSADSTKLTSFGSNSDSNTLLGAGSNFVYPLFSRLFFEYGKEAGIRVNYQSIGSGRGILQLTNKTIDFGDSDVPLSDDQIKKMGALVLNIPICRGAFIVIYKEQNYNGRSLQRAQKVAKLLWWNIHDGQKYCNELKYAPLSPAAVTVAERILQSATFEGKPLLP